MALFGIENLLSHGRDEYSTLPSATKTVVDQVIADCQSAGRKVNRDHSDGEIYAYPHPDGGIAWGVNRQHGNIARGIRT